VTLSTQRLAALVVPTRNGRPAAVARCSDGSDLPQRFPRIERQPASALDRVTAANLNAAWAASGNADEVRRRARRAKRSCIPRRVLLSLLSCLLRSRRTHTTALDTLPGREIRCGPAREVERMISHQGEPSHRSLCQSKNDQGWLGVRAARSFNPVRRSCQKNRLWILRSLSAARSSSYRECRLDLCAMHPVVANNLAPFPHSP